jgi:glutathione peroxidase
MGVLSMWKQLAVLIFMTLATQVASFEFESIDGGKIDLSEFQGKPVLIVNTASRCGFTSQLEGMQKLHETYGPKGLVVLAVPSNDFRQELKSGEDVKEFCEVTYGLTLPMTDITSVKGDKAHPFYKWLQREHGFKPRWNFYKVLLDANGNYVDSYSSVTKPMSGKLTRKIETLLR